MQTAPDASARIHDRMTGLDSLLLRITAWGTAAALAMGAAVFIAQTPSGTERLQVAFADTVLPQQAIAAKAPDPAVAILQAKFDRLSADRERLETRLTSLEQGLDDITGSIRSQSDRREPSVQAKAASQPFIEPPLIPRLETLTLTPRQPAPKREATPVPAPEPEIAKTPPAAEPKQSEAGPQAEAAAPVPPARVAALPPPAKRGAEFGIELGTAADMAALQHRWMGIKANHGPLLVGLSPVAVKDKHPGSASLRLIAGPVKSMAAARELCAKFAAQNGYCFPRQVDAAEIVQR